MPQYLFPPPEIKSLPVVGEAAEFPIRRIFCVGRNYAAHAAEMGNEVDREEPFYFTKSLTAVLRSGSTLPYPPGTEDFHYEMEFVVALGAPLFQADRAAARAAIFGYGCGLDMTRRDLQARAKKQARPWDLSKDVEGSAVLAPLTRAEAFGPVADQRIQLRLNGELRQDASLGDMVHSVEDILIHLSGYYHLQPGDIILTGTPAGVGAVARQDVLIGRVEGLTPVELRIGAGQDGI